MFLTNDLAMKDERRLLRNNATRVEKLLWQKLRKKQLGFQFRRQFGIGTYILDFYCPEKRLVVELDGGFHRRRKEYDKNRTEFLKSLNIKVMRFWNQEILENMDVVMEEIKREMMCCTPPCSSTNIPPLN